MADFTITDTIDINDLEIEDIKHNINRWIHDGPRDSLYGHFEQPIQNENIKSGSYINVNGIIGQILDIQEDGSEYYSIILSKPINTGRVRKIWNELYSSINFNKINTLNIQTKSNDILDVLFGISDNTNSNISGTINSYGYLSTSVSSTSSILPVNNSAASFPIGSEILIHQTQTTDTEILGLYEFNKIKDIQGNNIILSTPLKNRYMSGTFLSRPSHVAQVILVPTYHGDVTILSGNSISCRTWNGYYGGIIVVKCKGKITNNGLISANGSGFRGFGPNNCGESYYGYVASSGYYGNGGSQGGGAGGSHECLWHSIGGYGGSYGYLNSDKISLGGGGGTGITRIGYYTGGSGGNGGGLIFLIGKSIINNGTISSNGNSGGRPNNWKTGGGGGGSGGCISIKCHDITNNGNITTTFGSRGLGYPGSCYVSVGGLSTSGIHGTNGTNGITQLSSLITTEINPINSNSPTNIRLYNLNCYFKLNSFIVYNLNIDQYRYPNILAIQSTYIKLPDHKIAIRFDNKSWYYYDINSSSWISLNDISLSSMTLYELSNLVLDDYFKHPDYLPKKNIQIGIIVSDQSDFIDSDDVFLRDLNIQVLLDHSSIRNIFNNHSRQINNISHRNIKDYIL